MGNSPQKVPGISTLELGVLVMLDRFLVSLLFDRIITPVYCGGDPFRRIRCKLLGGEGTHWGLR